MLLFLVILVVFWLITIKDNSSSGQTKPYHDQIEEHTLRNLNYRKVLSTTDQMQLVLMSLKPGEEIGMEVHQDGSQFIRVEQGQGLAIIDGERYPMNDGNVVVIPAGARHNIVNLSQNERLQLYAIYSPPEHPSGIVQRNKPLNK